MAKRPADWKLISQTSELDLRILRVAQLTVADPRDGSVHPRVVLKVPEWVNVVAYTKNDEAILIRQFRFGTWSNTLEIPGGMVDEGESPATAAARELEEETGYRPGKLLPLGAHHPNPAIQGNQLHSFLALDCEKVHQGNQDLGEDISVELVPKAALRSRVITGEITHSLVLAAFFLESLRPQGSEISTPDFWNTLYLTGDTGWDKGEPSPPIARMLTSGVLAAGSSIAVIGAGRGHEAIFAAKRGFKVTAVDFAPEAVKAMQAARTSQGLDFEVLERDLFDLPRTHAAAFDAVLEHTCFCAIEVERRAEYVRAVHDILAPEGRLFGLFYAPGKPGGPPHTTSAAEVRELFSPHFEIATLETAPDSFEARAGKELAFVFLKKINQVAL